MKILVFHWLTISLAETGRHIEIAGTFFNVDIPIKVAKNDPQIAFFRLSGKKG
jgi:hypothetical protein